MPTGVVGKTRSEELRQVLPPHDWRRLAEMVRLFRPTVVILVARKMTRLVDLLSLDFGEGCVVVSDYAIPFIHHLLRGARVAIVDDVVNVGTTIVSAHARVAACGASEVCAFALAFKEQGRNGEECLLAKKGIPVRYVHEKALSEREHADFSHRVPLALGFAAKPYDLEFPIIECRYTVPFVRAAEVCAWLQDRFGAEAVHRLDRPKACDTGLSRFTVDVPVSPGRNYKLRFYADDDGGVCRLAPFAIGPAARTAPTGGMLARCEAVRAALLNRLQGIPAGCEVFLGESAYRVKLFFDSLEFGLAMAEGLSDVLTVENEECPFSMSDAVSLFGPEVENALNEAAVENETPLPGKHGNNVAPAEQGPDANMSPFWTEFLARDERGFMDAVRNRVKTGSPLALFTAFFSELADRAGAAGYASYTLDWPYSREEVAAEPYKRLRIGPTFGDLVRIMSELWGWSPARQVLLQNQVSAFLDWAIDDGGVVPTVAQYGGRFYRAYRKGENDPRDRMSENVFYALNTRQVNGAVKPISLTRLAKILAVMSFSSEVEDTLQPRAMPRGNTAEYLNTCVDTAGTEIAFYLRETNRLKRLKRRES